MSEGENPRKPYEYNFRKRGEDQSDQGTATGTSYETLISIRDSLLLMTGCCVVIQTRDGLFCERHKRSVVEGGTRCDYLASQLSRKEGEDQSKAQIQQYVNEVLGIRDPGIVRRLTGSG